MRVYHLSVCEHDNVWVFSKGTNIHPVGLGVAGKEKKKKDLLEMNERSYVGPSTRSKL